MYYKTDACTLIGLVIAHFVTNEAWWWEMSTKLLLHVPNQNSRPSSLLRNWNLQHGPEPNEQSSAIRRRTKPSPSISWARITRKFLGFWYWQGCRTQGFKGGYWSLKFTTAIKATSSPSNDFRLLLVPSNFLDPPPVLLVGFICL